MVKKILSVACLCVALTAPLLFSTNTNVPLLDQSTPTQNRWSDRGARLARRALWVPCSFVAHHALSGAKHVAYNYSWALIAGTAAGASTYATGRYFHWRARGLLSGMAFAGTTVLVAWIKYNEQLRRDVSFIRASVNRLEQRCEEIQIQIENFESNASGRFNNVDKGLLGVDKELLDLKTQLNNLVLTGASKQDLDKIVNQLTAMQNRIDLMQNQLNNIDKNLSDRLISIDLLPLIAQKLNIPLSPQPPMG
ncbi:MAG: hypothetical protein UW09_C0004G0032 [candidate division TM6 bacterium GW2011_GWF2_43_87]|nr:MAG: hypothetical protein UW09_C0004G0032 [candidate division TM6 bacterium GW2011_GWF2_43_87]